MSVHPDWQEMQLGYKCIVPCSALNSNNSAKGAYLFELMDLGAVTYLSQFFVNQITHVLVTTDSNIKYLAPVEAFDFIEVKVSVINISSSKITASVQLYNKTSKSENWTLAVAGVFSFSLIHTETRKLQRMPREVINVIKG